MSRQAKSRKEAAVAARDLLKADAVRVRKAGAGSKRNFAAAALQKSPAAPVRRASTAATPPSSFTDGSTFFNGNTGEFFSSPGPSSQPWNHQASKPAMWGTNPTPPGGFTNYLQPQMSQNFIFGGDPSQYASFRHPQMSEDVQSEECFSTPVSAKDKEGRTYVNVDSMEDEPRTEKRIYWTQQEDVSMMSSWLLNSTDSSCGADRRNDQYWVDVEITYNETAPSHRTRNAKQIKDRFHKVNRWTDLFHSAWLKAKMIYTSGYNEQMWIEKAHAFYLVDNKKLGPFVLMEVWNTVKTEAKWITYNNGLREARKKAASKGAGSGIEAASKGADKSPLFIQAIKGEAPRVNYTVNGTQYDTAYYLADGIYPEWAAFVKTVRSPQMDKHKLYAQRQEGARKDVECAFGVLQSRFDIVNRPARLWKRNDVVNIMQACVILHNMIVEDEKDLVKIPLDLNENPSATIVLPPEVQTNDNPNPCFVQVLNRNAAIRAASTHRQLKNDLIEHIWKRYGPRGG